MKTRPLNSASLRFSFYSVSNIDSVEIGESRVGAMVTISWQLANHVSLPPTLPHLLTAKTWLSVVQ